MKNVIHLSFINKSATTSERGDHTDNNTDVFHSYGLAAGHIVGLARDVQSMPESYIKIILKALDGPDHIVASFSDTPEGRFHADVTAMAILRSLSAIF